MVMTVLFGVISQGTAPIDLDWWCPTLECGSHTTSKCAQFILANDQGKIYFNILPRFEQPKRIGTTVSPPLTGVFSYVSNFPTTHSQAPPYAHLPRTALKMSPQNPSASPV